MLWQYAVVAVDLRVAQVRNHRPFESPDFSLLVQLPGAELVLGILDDVLQREPQHRGVLNFFKVKKEGHLPFQGLA